MSEPKLEGEELAQACARVARDMKAEDVEVLDLRGISSVADFFVLATANSQPHLRAIGREVSGRIAGEGGSKPTHREGNAESAWLVLDYIDVMVHVFREDKRQFYQLEKVWKDARRLDGPEGSVLALGAADEGTPEASESEHRAGLDGAKK